MDILRGWFYLADLNPQRGTEPGKTRPVLVIQTDMLNTVQHPSTVILPITTQIQDDATPLRVRIPAGHPGFDIDSDIMIDQIRAVDNLRFYRGNTQKLIKKIAPATDTIMREAERCLMLLLDMP
jgi:mRNA interferase MazF